MAGPTIEFKISGIDGVIEMLHQLPPEVVGKNGGIARTALRKAAKVVHARELANLAAVTANATAEGRHLSTGLLAANLVISRGKGPADGNGERQLVRVRRRVYPGRETTTLETARWLEYGSETQPAEPWIRPAAAATAEQAIQTAATEVVAGINRAVRKLAKLKGTA